MAEHSVILVDIGNTSTHLAMESRGRIFAEKRMPSQYQTMPMVARLLCAYAQRGRIDGAVICSVVPRLNRLWLKGLKKIAAGRVLLVNHKLNLGMKIRCQNPGAIGADRLANAVAAAEKYGRPVIVADFGTALTFDFVGADGAYEGGVITPGPMMLAECLAEKTALLPRLTPNRIRKAFSRKNKERLIGKKTAAAMLIGIRLGFIGLLKEMLARSARDPRYKNARLCATGGYAGMILSGNDLQISIDPLLTLRGLSRIYRMNS